MHVNKSVSFQIDIKTKRDEREKRFSENNLVI